ncbi:hypothetical protein R5W23_004355 [Gemmata sp. JC673]|uniref:Dihydroorotate dehydrogenase catalytic domain-containing protein n=1 Tax=Gemmata algarum TaxID=2975278 RepID=A0ABU5FAK8_9BACT|nr:hypothetical protein [Gemmata algarum]MDY3562874.1 hypothetical protein [Gemmata algarum]
MPDWFYRTVSRPLLYRLGARTARAVALGFMGRLARLPLGPLAIDLLGHMRADPRLTVRLLGRDFASPIGLGPGLDPEGVALPAFARFGGGFMSVGPVGLQNPPTRPRVARDDSREAIGFPDTAPPLGLKAAGAALAELSRLGVPVVARVSGETADEYRQLLTETRGLMAVVAVPARAAVAMSDWLPAAEGGPILLTVRADSPTVDMESLAAGLAAGASGILVESAVARAGGGTEIGAPARGPALALVRALRAALGPTVPLVAGGGVHEPEHALALLDAGADLVEVDSGLVFNGPGLVKRTNDAVLYRNLSAQREQPAAVRRPAAMTWFWTALLGFGMVFGGALAVGIAATRVVLPYDEAFLGLSRDQLHTVNPRLLAFMAHDRVSLAGPMLTVGLMYLGLSLGGVRRGAHWAMVAVFTSASAGFASFFLFLGFGYLDPLHAFVTACLLQLLLLGMHSELGPYTPTGPPPPRTDRAWRRAQWGQLLLVAHAGAVLVAGLVISLVGVTAVFVPEDLEFLETTAEQLRGAHPRLVPLVAHDRATFGGMLVSAGLVLLLTALWGHRAGNDWLWWTLLPAGVLGYAPAIAVHIAVGYTDGMHLLPAFAGLGVFLLGLALTRAHLCETGTAR